MQFGQRSATPLKKETLSRIIEHASSVEASRLLEANEVVSMDYYCYYYYCYYYYCCSRLHRSSSSFQNQNLPHR